MKLDDGDFYVMSEKASGNDEKKTHIPTLKHATGAKKFTALWLYWLDQISFQYIQALRFQIRPLAF